MAKEQFSFDIVSEVDMQEVANAVDQTRRELAQRFDFKGTETEVHQDNTTIDLRSSTEDRLKAALQVLKEKMVKREVPLKALQDGDVHPGRPAEASIIVQHERRQGTRVRGATPSQALSLGSAARAHRKSQIPAGSPSTVTPCDH